MDELIKSIQDQTGLPVDKAQGVIETVVNYIADQLPDAFGDQVKDFLDGDGDAGEDGVDAGDLLAQAKDALGGLGGLLGGDK